MQKINKDIGEQIISKLKELEKILNNLITKYKDEKNGRK